MTEQLIVYGARCIWFDTIDKASKLPSSSPGDPGLPCCPHCSSPLFQMDAKDWWHSVDIYERERHPGYRAYVEWRQGKCFLNDEAAYNAYLLTNPPGVS